MECCRECVYGCCASRLCMAVVVWVAATDGYSTVSATRRAVGVSPCQTYATARSVRCAIRGRYSGQVEQSRVGAGASVTYATRCHVTSEKGVTCLGGMKHHLIEGSPSGVLERRDYEPTSSNRHVTRITKPSTPRGVGGSHVPKGWSTWAAWVVVTCQAERDAEAEAHQAHGGGIDAGEVE